MSNVFALYFSVQSDQQHYYVGAQYSIDNKGIPVYAILYMNNSNYSCNSYKHMQYTGVIGLGVPRSECPPTCVTNLGI